jgi:hypothetical protein
VRDGRRDLAETAHARGPDAVRFAAILDPKATMHLSTAARRPSLLLAVAVVAVVAAVLPLTVVGAADAAPAARTARHPHARHHAARHHAVRHHAVRHQPRPARSGKAAWLRRVSHRLAGVPAYLDARAREGGRLAVVLGIDDVALATRYDWPHGVAPTLRVARHARRLGMAVFFVTGRLGGDARRLRGPLRRAGFRWTGICARDRGRRIAVGKELCRRSIESTGWTITANISSHRQAFHGGHFERAVLLPQIGRS